MALETACLASKHNTCTRYLTPCLHLGPRQVKKCLHQVQNAQIHIIMRMRNVSSGHLCSNIALYSLQWFYSEGADQTARMI